MTYEGRGSTITPWRLKTCEPSLIRLLRAAAHDVQTLAVLGQQEFVLEVATNSLAEGVSPSGSHRPRQRLHPRHDSSSKAKYGRVLPSLGSWRWSARGSRPVTLYCLVLVKQSTEFRWFAGCLPKVRMVPVPCSQAGVRRWVFPCPVPQPLLWRNIKEMSRTCLLRSYWNHSRSITEFSSVFSEQLGL